MSNDNENIELSEQVPGDVQSSGDGDGSDGGAPDEGLIVAQPRNPLSRSTLMMFGVLVIGAAGLFVMYKQAGPKSAGAATAKSRNGSLEGWARSAATLGRPAEAGAGELQLSGLAASEPDGALGPNVKAEANSANDFSCAAASAAVSVGAFQGWQRALSKSPMRGANCRKARVTAAPMATQSRTVWVLVPGTGADVGG
jgi:hypothetical protein